MFVFFGISIGAHYLTAATTTVSIRNNFFSPSTVTINVGDTVTWRQDGFNHNTEAVTGQAEFWRSAILSSGQTFSHTFTVPGTYQYFCAPHSSVMRGSVTVRPPATPPGIVTQPQSQTRMLGQSVTFAVVASGTAPLSYQWKLNNTNLPGATSSNFTIASVRSVHLGPYQVVITNAAGSTNSVIANLTVTIPSLALQTFPSAGGVVVCWPSGFTNFLLDSRSAVAVTSGWSTVTLNGGTVGTNFCHTNPIGPGPQFFRLRAPN